MNAADLVQKKCLACESGLPSLTGPQIQEHLGALPNWRLTADGRRIRRE